MARSLKRPNPTREAPPMKRLLTCEQCGQTDDSVQRHARTRSGDIAMCETCLREGLAKAVERRWGKDAGDKVREKTDG